ncbi:hypothetical protein [Maridesulfovibrio sp.]|uniref:hypothetical protein n=1 Tax=Maridesulfovibrio sp. TaxID=2795000 RepID=UPI002A18DC5E|nr:hypothetical protein [Maridesulfovibrio sp.]
MTNKPLLILLLFSLLFSVTGCQKNVFNSLRISHQNTIPDEKLYPDIKIAIVNFLPLPDSSRFKLPVNKKVMTAEFYCAEDEPDYDNGYFIPEEYMEIFHNNLKIWAEVNHINLNFFENLHGISKNNFDLIILGRIITASVSDSAILKVEILILDGNDFKLLRRSILSHEESKRQSDPIHTPVHFIGEHNENFCIQRTLLSVTALHLSEKIFATALEGRTK